MDVFVEEELIDDALGTATQQAVSGDLRVRIGRLEVVAEHIKKKFDTLASHCTTSMSMIEKRLGEIGHMSQFVDKSVKAKEVPHDMGGNNEEDEIDLTNVELDDPQATEGHHPDEMADVVFPRLTHINADVERAIYNYIYDKNLSFEYVLVYPIFDAITYA
ncbi:unnamed protein product [Ilex paraguariensis]|uniref:Uncharacterized protein n=1 Tax=Ilex paraguariensis TaxID=185542 RepID=A0ABC8UJK2_9AQUA